MALPIKITCPLGSECERVVKDEIHRCAWLVKLASTTSDGKTIDEDGCAIAWMPTLMVENIHAIRGTTAATESFRNETIVQSQTTNQILAIAVAKTIDPIYTIKNS